MNNNTYAIIDEQHNYLVNLVLWNGDLNIWQPPIGTIAVPAENIDFSNLPINDNNI